METIAEFILAYGLPVFILASIIIAIIGIMKMVGAFKKITNKDIKKLVYYSLNIVFAFAIAAIYFGIFKQPFSSYVTFSFTVVGATTTLYAIYENFGLRKCVRMFLAYIAQHLQSTPEDKIVKNLKKLGITDLGITEITQNINTKLDLNQPQTIVEDKPENTI